MAQAKERRGVPPTNLFTPGFGALPHITVGRDRLIGLFKNAYATDGYDSHQSSIIMGPRGSGKTVMLAEMRDIAESEGHVTIAVAAGATGLTERLIDQIRLARQAVDPGAGADVSVTKHRRVALGPLSFGRDKETHLTDPVDLRASLCDLADSVAEQGGAGVMITVDEMHRADINEIVHFSNEYQLVARTDLRRVHFAGGALPEAKHRFLNDDRLSFFRRSANLDIPQIDEIDARRFLRAVITDAGGGVSDEALGMLTAASTPVPYKMQLVGDFAWRIADAPFNEITAEHAEEAVALAEQESNRQIYEPMWASLTSTQQHYLMSLASLGGRGTPLEIADTMEKRPSRLHDARQRLQEHACIHVDDTRDDMPFEVTFGHAMGSSYAASRLREYRLNDPESALARNADAAVQRIERRTRGGPRCGKWMPRSRAYCVLRKGHPGGCRSSF